MNKSPFKRSDDLMLFGLGNGVHSWRGFWPLALVYFGAIICAALLAPPVYWAVVAWADASPNGLNAYLANKSFDDYFDRLRWLPVLIAFPWIFRFCGLFSWDALKVKWRLGGSLAWLRWFGMGVVLVAAIAVLQALQTAVDPHASYRLLGVLGIVLKALIGGVLLGFLEEIVFRGLIFRIFYTAMAPLWATCLSALFFAYTHFKMPDAIWDATDQVVTWKSGFFVGLWTILGITQNFEPLPFLNLCMLGLVLNVLFMRTRSLMPCMGFHAGVVTVMLSYKKLFSIHADSTRWLWGGGKMVDGLMTGVLLAVLLLMLCLLPKRDETSNS